MQRLRERLLQQVLQRRRPSYLSVSYCDIEEHAAGECRRMPVLEPRRGLCSCHRKPRVVFHRGQHLGRSVRINAWTLAKLSPSFDGTSTVIE